MNNLDSIDNKHNDWIRNAAAEGQNCPMCYSALVKCVGANPDGINLNAAYDCQVCGAQWEGN